jgi:hypothetical protein
MSGPLYVVHIARKFALGLAILLFKPPDTTIEIEIVVSPVLPNVIVAVGRPGLPLD